MKSEKTKNSRNYALDSSEDEIVKLIIELFPSPTGVLCHIRNKKDNFGYVFKNNKKEGIEFMSNMFLNLLGIETNYSTDNQVFNRIQSVIVNKEDCCFADAKTIKLLTLHSFILNVLDDKNDLKEYIESIVRKVEMKYLDTILIYDVTNEVLRLRRDYLSFPYSELNQPCSNSIVPIYDRKNDKFIQKTFSDCADIVILHICNCLFYDNEKFCYSIDRLDPNSDLFKFYENHKELFTITDDIRKDWSKVIQGLDNFEIEDKSIYKLHKIAYLKEKRNEVDTGIINMMNILIRICNLNHQEIMRDFNPNSIFEIFESLLNRISRNKMIISVNEQNCKILKAKNKVEIFGSFDIVFENKDGERITIHVNQDINHASLEVIEFRTERFKSPIPRISVSEDLLSRMFICYSELDKIKTYSNYPFSFENLYFKNPISTRDQKKDTMVRILDIIAKDNNSNEDILKGILTNILNSTNLDDWGTRVFYTPCLVYEDVTDFELITCWEKTLQFEHFEVYKLWEKRILEAEKEDLLLDISEIPLSRIAIVFEAISKMKKLKSLKISRINSSSVPLISNEPHKLNQIEELDISKNHINSLGIELISRSIEQMNNLLVLDISHILMDSESSMHISKALTKLSQLVNLDLSSCSIGFRGIGFISESFKYLKNLKILNLSNNRLCWEGAKSLSQTLGKLKQLNFLNLSFNKLGIHGVKLIENKTKELVNLKECNLTRNIWE